MKRLNFTICEFLESRKSSDDFEPGVTLDGYVIDEYLNYSYDNNFDLTLPNLLQGVENPDAEKRHNQSPKRNPRFPRKLKRIQKKNIKFWVERQANLSEILSAYPHLSAGIKLGRRTANELLSLVLYVNIEMRSPIQSLPLGEDLFGILERRCKKANYQGNWRILAKLLQSQRSYIANRGFIEESFSKRSLYGNFLPMGYKVLEQVVIQLSIFPVFRPNRKRGYSDKGSKKLAHETHDLTISTGSVEVTRDTLDLSPREAIVHFLYGYTNPVKTVKESQEEKDYRKRINQQRNQRKRIQAKRIRELSGPVYLK